jgi:hypothetical protein
MVLHENEIECVYVYLGSAFGAEALRSHGWWHSTPSARFKC